VVIVVVPIVVKSIPISSGECSIVAECNE